MTTRFIVCIDIDADNLVDAYTQLDKIMHNEVNPSDIAWESSDEAYQDDGQLIDPVDIQDARHKAYQRIRTEAFSDFPQRNSDYGNICLECDATINYGPRSEHGEDCKYFRDELIVER